MNVHLWAHGLRLVAHQGVAFVGAHALVGWALFYLLVVLVLATTASSKGER